MGLPSSIDPDPKKLGKHICAYLLCGDYSLLSAAAASIVKAARFGLPIKITGKAGDRYNRAMKVIKRLGIPCTEVEFTPQIGRRPDIWTGQAKGSDLHVWIPGVKDLVPDLGLLTAFYIKLHLTELRKHAPDFPEPKVDSTYILLLWSHLLYGNYASFGPKIMHDLLNAEATKRLIVYDYSGGLTDSMRAVHGRTRDLPDTALMYLGFTSNGQLARELLADSPLRRSAFNKHTETMIGAMAVPGMGGGAAPSFVWHVRPMSWDIGSLSMVMRKVWDFYIFQRQGISEKAKERLVLRLRGLSEEEIADRLGFESFGEYSDWALQSRVALAPKEPKDPYQDWLEACEALEIEPDLADVGVGESKSAGEPAVDDAQLVQQLEPEFRFTPDYRSLRLPSGQEVALTPKQAQVIQMLHEAKVQGTSQLSQSQIINEVYGVVKENRLKKLFADNELWDLLIEPGTRKGLFRLKVD